MTAANFGFLRPLLRDIDMQYFEEPEDPTLEMAERFVLHSFPTDASMWVCRFLQVRRAIIHFFMARL